MGKGIIIPVKTKGNPFEPLYIFELFEGVQKGFPLKWRKQASKNNDEFPISSLGCGDLMFIGHCKDLEPGGEFGYYIKTPELLYSLPALLPEIISYSAELAKMDVYNLKTIFGQEPCIWTFASDCHCCG